LILDGNDTILTPAALNDPAFYNAAWEEYTTNRTGVFTFGLSGRIVFSPLQDFNPDFEAIAQTVTSSEQLDYLPASYKENPALLAGYRKQLQVLQNQFLNPHAGVVEISAGGSGAVSLALQKPLSRGTVRINSTDSNPSKQPLIDWNSGANPLDLQISISAIRKVREFMAAASLASLNITEVVPGVQYQSDAELEALLRASLYGPSFAHPAGTAAMLPRELGGVVGSDLRVYGVEGVWVVDASVIPILPAAHTQAMVYAVAEFAADMIKESAVGA
jgi:choline dehydrogenase-like flavoprotein